MQLIGRRQLFPSFAKGVVGIGHHDESVRVGLFYLCFQPVCFFVADHEEEHFLVFAGIEAAALDIGGAAFQLVEDIVVEVGHFLVTDDEYLNKTGVSLSKAGKEQAIKSEKISQKILKRKDLSDSARNIVQTGHNAGITAAKSAGTMGLTMSGIMNITAVIRGEKSAEDAVTDTIVSAGKSAATGYVMGGGLTTISHTLSGSSSKFLRALSESNVPGKVITTVMVMGDTLKRYANGEITTQECMIELGEKGLNLATAGYSMAVGQALIPIPVVGAAVGALVGSMITSSYYRQLITTLQTKELEHQERLRIIAECEEASRQARLFRQELENYLSSYFKDYQDCFDEAIALLQTSFQTGDTNGIIEGANQITKKLGGKVYYNNMDEFEEYLFDDSTDLL